MTTHEQIGKAYQAFAAYNHKAKLDRITHFDLQRWVNVVKAVEASTPTKVPTHVGVKTKGGWSPARRKKFMTTIAKKNGAHAS